MRFEHASRILDRETLVVIPCSGTKTEGGASGETFVDGPSILHDLPREVATMLRDARDRVARVANCKPACLMPAYRRYSGSLYRAAGQPLQAAIECGEVPHLLILSGGYGIVRACEPIADYNRKINPTDWPVGLIQDVVAAYAEKHGLCRASLFATGDYAKVLKKTTPSVRCGLTDVLLFTPTRIVRGGAQFKAPTALGEALRDMLTGKFHTSWESSHGLTLGEERLLWSKRSSR